jgi:hypothetical protein
LKINQQGYFNFEMAELLAGRSGGIPAKSAARVISFSIFVALFKIYPKVICRK